MCMYVYMILPFESYDKLKIREAFAQAYIHTYLGAQLYANDAGIVQKSEV